MSSWSIFAEAARSYAAAGWAVFPLRAREKTPIIGPSTKGARDGGFHIATADLVQIEAWWSRWPNANIGLATGAASGVFVLDLDGPEAEAGLTTIGDGRAPPHTREQRTGKGRHLFFVQEPGVVNRGGGYLNPQGLRVACAGFDVRGDGGYVVLPPSVHPSGRLYAWVDEGAPIARAPDWLLRAIVPRPPQNQTSAAAKFERRDVRDGRASKFGEAALDSACHRIAQAAPGTQNTTLTREAAAIGELVAGGEVERAYAQRALVQAGMSMANGGRPWRAEEIEGKVAWGFEVGAARPREARFASGAARAGETRASSHAPSPQPSPAMRERERGSMRIAPPDANATLLVAAADYAERAVLAWEDAGGAPYGLYETIDVAALAGGLARNKGGYDDWRNPRPDPQRRAATWPWRGRVLIVLPGDLEALTLSPRTRFEMHVSAERHANALALCAAHWWRAAGAAAVSVAVLPREVVSEGGVSL